MESKYNRFKNLKPDYHFRIDGDAAYGRLPDGTEFIIDRDNTNLVNSYFFHRSAKGYIYTLKSKTKKENTRLHWLVFGYTSRPPFIIDHINRNKMDCRRCNLRIVSSHQNSMNRSISKTNRSGYTGAYVAKHGYIAKICFNYHRIYLLKSDDPVVCAQAYNYAAQLLFGEFAGHINDVPDASDEIKEIVWSRCSRYLGEARIITTPIDIRNYA